MRKVRHQFQQASAGKHRNIITEVDGIKFRSKKEARYYCDLKIRQQAGEVEMFLMQVPFHLPGGIKYVADFMVFLADGTAEVIDVKGQRLPEYKTKKKLVEFNFPVEIKEV